jgi:hypothetical protein
MMQTSRWFNLRCLGYIVFCTLILIGFWMIRISNASNDQSISATSGIQSAARETGVITDGSSFSPASTNSVTYYVRTDGGDTTQCTGLVDAPFVPGSGTKMPCAWNHPFQALSPDGTVRIAGGDTLIIGPGDYMMGYGSPGTQSCDYEGSYDCLMAALPSGPDADHPTRLLGKGWDSGCNAPPQLWGSGRPWYIVNLTDSSNVEVACLEITDRSSCIEDHLGGGSPYTCQRDTPPYGDWADTGLYAEDSVNVRLQDINIHGLANTGIVAGRLTDWTVERVEIVGNGLAGWNFDLVGDGSDSENHGTLTFRHWLVAWNGCGETYPELQHIGCWGQEAGGYGDGAGFGGISGGHYIIEDAAFLDNTSDGLDMLYIRLPGSQIEIRRTIAAGNDGNQIKLTADQSLIENTIIVSNCGRFHDMPYWNNADDCRAAGDALALFLRPGGQSKVVNTTITGEGTCLMIAGCAIDETCYGSEQILVRNSLFQGGKVFYNPDEDTCFAWYDDESSPPMPANPFVIDYSLMSQSMNFGNVNPCPGDHNQCDVADIGLAKSTIDSFNAHLLEFSPAIDAGTTAGAPTRDYAGLPRDNHPDVGAYEYNPYLPKLYLPSILR